jgi:trehalose 6-phosphate synthase/phosphatase
MASPDENLYKLIEDLKSDTKNDLIIVSGRDKETLDKWFGDKDIKMVAEHGVWIYTNKEWVISEQMNDVWKDTFRPIVQRYVDRTPGSFFEEKNYSLVWHYRKADPELGKNRSIELKDEVTSMIANHNLEIMEGNKVVEIKASGINKGKAVQNCLSGYDYDFILAIGDDWTDEYMFQSLPTDAYTIKVGSINTHARIIINSVSEVRDFLKSLTNL